MIQFTMQRPLSLNRPIERERNHIAGRIADACWHRQTIAGGYRGRSPFNASAFSGYRSNRSDVRRSAPRRRRGCFRPRSVAPVPAALSRDRQRPAFDRVVRSSRRAQPSRSPGGDRVSGRRGVHSMWMPVMTSCGSCRPSEAVRLPRGRSLCRGVLLLQPRIVAGRGDCRWRSRQRGRRCEAHDGQNKAHSKIAAHKRSPGIVSRRIS